MRAFRGKLISLLLVGETAMLRFWFAVASFGYGSWALMDSEYAIMHPMSLRLASDHMQGVLFLTHALALIYGVKTGKFSNLLLFVEGILGVFLWCGIGIAEAIQQGTPGPMLLGGGGISMFLLLRYPTHYSAGDSYAP